MYGTHLAGEYFAAMPGYQTDFGVFPLPRAAFSPELDDRLPQAGKIAQMMRGQQAPPRIYRDVSSRRNMALGNEGAAFPLLAPPVIFHRHHDLRGETVVYLGKINIPERDPRYPEGILLGGLHGQRGVVLLLPPQVRQLLAKTQAHNRDRRRLYIP